MAVADYRRAQASDLATAPDIAVQSRPLDTYVRPTIANPALQSETGDAGLNALAESLKALNPLVGQSVSEINQQISEEEIKKGMLARESNQEQFRKAGIFGAANPWFVKGYMRADGRLAGEQFYQEAAKEWQESGLANSDNMGDFQRFMAEKKKAFIGANQGKSADWIDGFMPELAKAENNLLNAHISAVASRIEQTRKDQFGLEVAQSLNDQLAREADPVTGAGDIQSMRAAVAADLQRRASELVKSGMPGHEANKILAQQIIATAKENHDTTLIEGPNSLLAQIKTPGGSIANITEIKAASEEASAHIRSAIAQDKHNKAWDEDRPAAIAHREFGLKEIEHRQKEWDRQQVSQDREDRVRGFESDLMMSILAGKPLDYDKLQKLAADSAERAAFIKNFKHTLAVQNAEIIPNQKAMANLMLRMSADPSKVTDRDIFGGVTSGQWPMAVAMQLHNELQQMTSPGMDKATRDPFFVETHSGLTAAVRKNLTGLGNEEYDAASAGKELRLYYNEINADEKITPSERMTLLNKKSLDILMHYKQIAAERSITAQDAGVVPQPTIRGEGAAGAPPIQPRPVYNYPGSASQIPWNSVDFLFANPNTAADFNRKYNLSPGSAESMLRRGRQHLSRGGFVTSGDPQSTHDDVPAMLQEGEYVLPRRIMQAVARKAGGPQQAEQVLHTLINTYINHRK